MVARHIVICIKMLIQPSMPREINCELQEIFQVTENTNRNPFVCNCPLNIAPTISKVHKWNVHFAEAGIRGLHVGVGVADNRPPLAKPPLTGFLRDLALIARIRGGDLGLHMAAAPIEHHHTSGRAGREGRAQVFAHKRNPWP